MRLPRDDQGILICGRRGSGKTQEALHQLSLRSFDVMPWIAIDFKGGDLMSKIPVSAAVSIRDPLPVEPGLYVALAEIEDQGRGGPVDDYLIRIFKQGNIGVVIDELQSLGQYCRGLRLILTQGRSKTIPTIFAAQRPVAIDRWALSESEFVQTFHLQLPDDQERITEHFGKNRLDFDALRDMGEYHSAYYDVLANTIEYVEPCPSFADIYDRIRYRLPKYEELPTPDYARRIRV